MVRFFGAALIVLSLPACAVNTPRSFGSFSGEESTRPPAVAPAAAYAPSARSAPESGGGGSTLGNWWNSVKSSFGSNDQTASSGGGSPVRPAKSTAFDPAEAQRLVNAYRAQKGLKPLKLNSKLSAAAKKHSEDLAKSDRISHFGSDGSDAWERVRKAGYGAKVTAENVGTGQQSLDEVFKGWQNSRDHNANLLLRDADEMGIAMVYNPDSQFKTFWTMVVASPRNGG